MNKSNKELLLEILKAYEYKLGKMQCLKPSLLPKFTEEEYNELMKRLEK